MQRFLRDLIHELAKAQGVKLDAPLENFIFDVASQWGDHRVNVHRDIRDGKYEPE